MGYTKKRISSSTISEVFIVSIFDILYEVKFVSELDLFIKYKTTGSVSKTTITLGIPPKLTTKLVDDRSCYITHSSDFNFNFYITAINRNEKKDNKLSVEVKSFSNFLLQGIEMYLSNLPAGMLGHLGLGALCKCNGSIGKKRIKTHKGAYIDAFNETLKEAHNFIAKNFSSILERVFKSDLEFAIPKSLQLDKVKEQSLFRERLFKSVIGTKPTPIEVKGLHNNKVITSLNKYIVGVKIKELKQNLPTHIIDKDLKQLEEISKKIKALEDGENNTLTQDDNEVLDILRPNQFADLSSFEQDVDLWGNIPANYCICIPGEYGIMNPYVFPENIGLSNEIEKLYNKYVNAKQNSIKLINEGRKYLSLADALDIEFESFSKYINKLDLALETFDSRIIKTITFKQLYYKCTSRRTPMKAEDPYRAFLSIIKHPNINELDIDPPKDLDNIMPVVLNTNNQTNIETKGVQIPVLKFSDFIKKLPTEYSSDKQKELIIKALKFAKENERLSNEASVIIDSVTDNLIKKNDDIQLQKAFENLSINHIMHSSDLSNNS